MKAERGFVFRILRKRSLAFWERVRDQRRTARMRREHGLSLRARRRFQRSRATRFEETPCFPPGTPRLNRAAERSQRVAISEVCAVM